MTDEFIPDNQRRVDSNVVPPQVKEQGNRMPATQPAVTISDDAVKYVLSASGKEADTRNVPDDIPAGKY